MFFSGAEDLSTSMFLGISTTGLLPRSLSVEVPHPASHSAIEMTKMRILEAK